MLFNTLSFAAFFVIVFGLYYSKPLARYQIPLLIAASMVFYAWTAPILLVLLIVSVLLNTVTSFKVAGARSDNAWRWALAGVVCNLTILGIFKYGGLLANTFQEVFRGGVVSPVHIPLPIGISFYTFEGISLLMDTIKVRRDQNQWPQFVSKRFGQHILDTSLFIVFFPHLIAGPILKARHFYPQIGPKRFADVNWELAGRSLVIGYFLKTVIADNLSDYTSFIAFPYYRTLNGSTAAGLLYGYSMQIYADFAGYSLIAIGLARLLGYDLPPNFNFPYISRSIAEFWRRWHISLSTWLRDYLYFSLGGSRKGRFRTYVNLTVVMLLGGLWHGAAWSYLVWGGYQGLGLAFERAIFGKKVDTDSGPSQNMLDFASNSLRMLLVFLFITCGWLLFRLPNIADAAEYMRLMIGGITTRPEMSRLFPIFVYSLPVLFYHWYHLPRVQQWRMTRSTTWLRFEVAAVGLAFFGCLVNGGNVGEFIYFQF